MKTETLRPRINIRDLPRNLIRNTVGVGVLAATLAACGDKPEPSPSSTPLLPAAGITEQVPFASESPITDPVLEQAQKQGIQESKREKRRWNFDDSLVMNLTENEWATLSFEELIPISDAKLSLVFTRMSNSENPYFKDASDLFLNLEEEKRLKYESNLNPYGMGAAPGLNNDGKVTITLLQNPRYILSEIPLDLAYGLTRLSIFSKIYIDRYEQGKGLGMTDEEMIDTITVATAQEVQAFIDQTGRMGRKIGDPDLQQAAAVYIQNGSNSNTPGWRRFVAESFGITPRSIGPTA